MPLWALILQAADSDPLRAQEIEEKLSRDWWEYWMIYTRERNEAAKETADKDSS